MAGHYSLLTQPPAPLLTSADARGPQDAGLKVHTSLINRDLLMPKLPNISKLAKIPSQLHNYCRGYKLYFGGKQTVIINRLVPKKCTSNGLQ